VIQNNSRYVLAYLLWAVSVASALAILLISRSAFMVVLGVTQWDRYVEHAINQFGFLFLAIFGLSVIVFTEHFYRTGVEKNRLFARFFLISLLELIFLTLAHGTRLLGETMLGFLTPATLALVGAEVVLCGLLFWLYRQASQRVTSPL